MKKSINPLEVQRYFKNWRVDFSSVLATVIADQLGYQSKGKSGFSRVPNISKKHKNKVLNQQRRNLSKFQKLFTSLCEKFAVFPAVTNRNETIPKKIVERALGLHLAINAEIHALKKTKSVRIRRRIPNDIAFELARALRFCSGDGNALKVFKRMIENQNDLNQEVTKTILRQKLSLTIWLMDQMKATRILMKHAKTKSRKRQLDDEYRKLEEAQKHLRRYKNTFSLIGGSRGKDTKWASHLKEHLIRSILSEGKVRLIKGLSDQAEKQKKTLIKKMDQKNATTLMG